MVGLEEMEPLILYGASPRASIALTLAAKAAALFQGRTYVLPKDIKDVGLHVLGHRVQVSYEAEAEELSSEDIVTKVLDGVRVP